MSAYLSLSLSLFLYKSIKYTIVVCLSVSLSLSTPCLSSCNLIVTLFLCLWDVPVCTHIHIMLVAFVLVTASFA